MWHGISFSVKVIGLGAYAMGSDEMLRGCKTVGFEIRQADCRKYLSNAESCPYLSNNAWNTQS